MLSGTWRNHCPGITETRIAILYHASITASAMLTPTAGQPGASGVLSALIDALLIWAAALALVFGFRRDFTANGQFGSNSQKTGVLSTTGCGALFFFGLNRLRVQVGSRPAALRPGRAAAGEIDLRHCRCRPPH